MLVRFATIKIELWHKLLEKLLLDLTSVVTQVEKPGTFFPVGNKYNFIKKLYNLELSSEVG